MRVQYDKWLEGGGAATGYSLRRDAIQQTTCHIACALRFPQPQVAKYTKIKILRFLGGYWRQS